MKNNCFLSKYTRKEKTDTLIHLDYIRSYYEEYFILLKKKQIRKTRKQYKNFKKLLEAYNKVIEDIEESL